MKRVILMLLLVICASPLFSQNLDSLAKLDPKTSMALDLSDQAAYQLAIRYNDFDVAKVKLYDLLLRNPTNIRYAELLASLYFELNQSTSAALVALDIIEGGNGNNTTALEIAAYSLEQVGALDRALPHFESLYLLTGDNFSLYKSAFIQFSLKRFPEALNSVNMLVKNAKPDEKIGFPKSATETQQVDMKAAALNLKGMIYLEQGSKAEAKTAFEEAIAIEPTFELAKENLKKAI
ncbi:MAG: tetratricopeptide repeat protein [Algoriphagus sp.]|nr:tetratricopeptide repeat protein [Algoriphagus sp.]